MNECYDNLHCLPEVRHRDSHGAVLIDVSEEVPQTQLALIQIVLHSTCQRRGKV